MADEAGLVALTKRRWRVAISLTTVMVSVYFAFILIVAYNKSLAGTLLGEGLSLGILLGALVIVVAWIVTGVYVYWANKTYDVELERLRSQQ